MERFLYRPLASCYPLCRARSGVANGPLADTFNHIQHSKETRKTPTGRSAANILGCSQPSLPGLVPVTSTWHGLSLPHPCGFNQNRQHPTVEKLILDKCDAGDPRAYG